MSGRLARCLGVRLRPCGFVSSGFLAAWLLRSVAACLVLSVSLSAALLETGTSASESTTCVGSKPRSHWCHRSPRVLRPCTPIRRRWKTLSAAGLQCLRVDSRPLVIPRYQGDMQTSLSLPAMICLLNMCIYIYIYIYMFPSCPLSHSLPLICLP